MKFFSRIIDTFKIDVFALNPNACWQPLENNFKFVLDRQPWRKTTGISGIACLISFFLNTARNTFGTRNQSVPEITDRFVFLSQTKNQETSLLPIFQSDQINSQSIMICSKDLDFLKDHGKAYWLSLIFMPALMIMWIKGTRYQRRSFRHALDDHMYTYGLYYLLRQWLCNNRPKAIIVSNDHIQFPCTFVAAAKGRRCTNRLHSTRLCN